jgi:uncharacterized peroxidase-related enzyme
VARVTPLGRGELTAFEAIFEGIERSGNVVPNSMYTMGRIPELLDAYAALNAVVYRDGRVSGELKRLVAHVASRSAGCRYCAAHNGVRASGLGVDPDKIAAVWEFETSELFSDAERCALDLARRAGQSPNEVTDESFETLRAHFDDAGILELVAVIAMTGFTNRWNETLSTDFEETPMAFADTYLSPSLSPSSSSSVAGTA